MLLPSSPNMLRSSLESCLLRSPSRSPARNSSSSSMGSSKQAAVPASSRLVPSSPRGSCISTCRATAAAAAAVASASPTMLQHRERRRVELYALNAILARNDELQVAAYLAQLQQQQHQQHCSAQAGLLLSLALPADATQQCATSSAGSSKACAVLASHGV
uniref:Uncharacterized protein n=1 Tax=Tetradesmus obliquus TaxID=3088 RepID=A0A383VB21_TETOB|eukprot:jgi/Sobl393_1/17504/SZX62758.1